MEIFRDVCIKCTRCIYKTASELSKCCIAIVNCRVTDKGTVFAFISELIEENEEDEELSEVEG